MENIIKCFYSTNICVKKYFLNLKKKNFLYEYFFINSKNISLLSNIIEIRVVKSILKPKKLLFKIYHDKYCFKVTHQI